MAFDDDPRDRAGGYWQDRLSRPAADTFQQALIKAREATLSARREADPRRALAVVAAAFAEVIALTSIGLAIELRAEPSRAEWIAERFDRAQARKAPHE